MSAYDKYLGPEDHLHIAVCRYLSLQYPIMIYHHSPNESKRGHTAQYKIKAMGVKAGFPDLIIFFAGRHLAIELKAGKNTASAHQKQWIEALKANGWDAFVCTGFEEAKKAIDDFAKG